jgi:murein DD-endopeptidase MepM/ murein hydrolase activator NlpD
MRSYVVTPGEHIKKNQIIGYMGSTGYSTGVHLHYEVRIANKPVDPWSYLNVD